MIFYLNMKAMKNRLFTTLLCLFSIALSVALFLGVERVRTGARDGFTQTISQTDLIVGARGGSLQLLLYSVFHIGNPSNNLRFTSYEKIKNHPMVSWTIPFSLGDSYRGHRVVGTSTDFFTYYRFRGDKQIEFAEGNPFSSLFEVVVGAEVAKKFQLKLGDPLTLSHGISTKAILEHDQLPFKITGILAPTQTPVDKALYISLQGMEAIHIGWESGVPKAGSVPTPDQINPEEIKINQLTAFLLGAKNRIQVLRLRNDISQFSEEPLQAVIPALALQELWQTLSYVEQILLLISLCVFLVGLTGILISLYTSVQERRREMAILRSLGAGLKHIAGLLIAESLTLVIAGSLLGIGLFYLMLALIGPYLESEFSLYLPLSPLALNEWKIIGMVVIAGLGIGLIPALKASFNSLQDGLTQTN